MFVSSAEAEIKKKALSDSVSNEGCSLLLSRHPLTLSSHDGIAKGKKIWIVFVIS